MALDGPHRLVLVPSPRAEFEDESAQEAIGERFLQLLEALAISCAHQRGKIPILSGRHELSPQVRGGLDEYLGVKPEGRLFEQFVSQLGTEFYSWMNTNQREREDFGLECDAQA